MVKYTSIYYVSRVHLIIYLYTRHYLLLTIRKCYRYGTIRVKLDNIFGTTLNEILKKMFIFAMQLWVELFKLHFFQILEHCVTKTLLNYESWCFLSRSIKVRPFVVIVVDLMQKKSWGEKCRIFKSWLLI